MSVIPHLAKGELPKVIGVSRFNDIQRGMYQDSATTLTQEEITVIRQQLVRIIRPKTVSDGFPIRNIGRGNRIFKFYSIKETEPPRWTTEFDRGLRRKVVKELSTIELMGMDYDFHISMVERDASASNALINFSESLMTTTFNELAEKLAIYREFFIFRGTDIADMPDLGFKGIVNYPGITDPGPLGLDADDDLTTYGDGVHSVVKMANTLIENNINPPFELHLSKKVYEQFAINKNDLPTSLFTTDLELISRLSYGNTQIFNRIVVNPYLNDSLVEDNTSGAILVIKPDPTMFEIVESYPMGFYPLPSVDLGISGKLLWMGGLAVYHPEAICFRGGLTTNV